jgi:hypothetical protein
MRWVRFCHGFQSQCVMSRAAATSDIAQPHFMETTACYAEQRERRKRKPSIGHVRTLRSKGSKGPIKDRSIELNEANGVIL